MTTTKCNVCAELFDREDWRFAKVTKKWSWTKPPLTHCRGAVAKTCGFDPATRPLCAKCSGLLSVFLAEKAIEPTETAGNLWLAARLGSVAKHTANPGMRTRDAAQRRAKRSVAKQRIDALEDALDAFVWDTCPYDSDGNPYDDEAEDEASQGSAWWVLHNELISLCSQHNLRSRYGDQDWEPEWVWSAYQGECRAA